jgi:large subunit ribosomal protein L22
VRRVARLLAGRPVNDALSVLLHVPNRGAPMLRKVIASAVANAERVVTERHLDVDLNDLVVATAFVDGGPIMKRWRPAARGAPSPRRKRFCHISVVLRPPRAGEAAEE